MKKALTPAQKKLQEARERRLQRDMARDVAGQIKTVLAFQGKPDSQRANLQHEINIMFALLNIFLSSNLDIAPRFLRMIADAFDGKLRRAKYDPAISEANWRARINGKRKQERSHPWRPLFSELNDAMASVLTEIGYKNGPTPDGLRRRHEILGYSLSKKQGRHRGEKPKPTGQSKDTKPLTAEEKKTIRDLEWSIPKAQIEREIGRPYKRTDDGDYVAVRAGS